VHSTHRFVWFKDGNGALRKPGSTWPDGAPIPAGRWPTSGAGCEPRPMSCADRGSSHSSRPSYWPPSRWSSTWQRCNASASDWYPPARASPLRRESLVIAAFAQLHDGADPLALFGIECMDPMLLVDGNSLH